MGRCIALFVRWRGTCATGRGEGSQRTAESTFLSTGECKSDEGQRPRSLCVSILQTFERIVAGHLAGQCEGGNEQVMARRPVRLENVPLIAGVGKGT